jgi:hypothetical protein
MLSDYRRDSSLSVSGGVSGSYNHPAGVAKAIKGKVKKKSFSRGWNFSTFTAHLLEQDPAIFIARSQRSLSVPKPAKQNVGQIGDHSSI